jgi:parallel beta-helix repeat protein
MYRLERPLNPKANQRLSGTKGAVLNGAKPVSEFVPAGANFVASGFLPSTPSEHGSCVVPGCTYAQDVFLDGKLLSRVTSLSELAPGTFYEDFSENKIYLRDDPNGHMIEQAYAPSLIRSSNPGITIQDLVIEKAATEAQTAAVMSEGTGWVIQYNEVRLNHGQGIACSNCVMRNNLVHRNGELGVSGANGSQDLVESNEIAYNNTAGYDPLWEAGGGKWWSMTNLVIKNNYVHHNRGPGLWTDTNNKHVTVEHNYVSYNDDHGIYHEVSYDAKIRRNVAIGNGFHINGNNTDGWGGVGIRIAHSPRVEVSGNRVIANRNGILAVQQARTEAPDPEGGPHELNDLAVRDNDVSMTVGVTGIVQDVSDSTYFTKRGNRFTGNHYHLDAAEALRFGWEGDHLTAVRWKEYGNDQSGTFDTSIAPAPDPPSLQVGPRAS